MGEHEQFGHHTTRRPRSAGVLRPSPRFAGARLLAPEQLASAANREPQVSVTKLSERLLTPRPGSASPRAAVMTTQMTPELAAADLKPTVLLSKPPARPKSAFSSARGRVSQHRLDRVQQHGQASLYVQAMESNNQLSADGRPPRPTTASTKQDTIRPSASTFLRPSHTIQHGHRTAPKDLDVPSRPYLKRPSSTMAVVESIMPTPSVDMARHTEEPSNYYGKEKSRSLEPRSKRPHSAAPTCRVVTPSTSSAGTSEHSVHRSQAIQGTRIGVMTIMSTFHRNTFVYATPRHCLEPGQLYNPYDIVTVSHEALFGSTLRRVLAAKFDYYTISATGFTFHCKDNDFEPVFLTTNEWEQQKLHFTKISRLPTFQLFRYRKVFIAWKTWIRSYKINTAKANLLSLLYFCVPLLNGGMQKIQLELVKLGELNLLCDFEGKTHDTSQFAARNREYTSAQHIEVLKISRKIEDILLAVCNESLLAMEQHPHGQYGGEEFAMASRKSSNAAILDGFANRARALATANHRLLNHEHFYTSMRTKQPKRTMSQIKQGRSIIHNQVIIPSQAGFEHSPQDSDQVRWTLAAIRRSQCTQLTKFICLIDFMEMEVYHSIIVRSVERLRDSLLFGANVIPITTLTDRREYLLAFHKTLQSKKNEHVVEQHEICRAFRPIALTKHETKRFLRAAWDSIIPTVLKLEAGASAGPSEHKSSASVWLGSQLELFMMKEVARGNRGKDIDMIGIDEIMFVVENTLPQALVLPDFDPACCSIENLTSTKDARLDCPNIVEANDVEVDDSSRVMCECIQRAESLSPVALFHVKMVLTTDPRSKKAGIKFDPGFESLGNLIEELIAGFIQTFQDIPTAVARGELRSILEFAEDFRSYMIRQGYDADPAEYEEEEDSGSARWSKTNYDRLMVRISEDLTYEAIRQNIDELVESAMAGAEAFVMKYAESLRMHTVNEEMNLDSIRKRFRTGNYSLQDMKDEATAFNNQLLALDRLKESQTIEYLEFNMENLKSTFAPAPRKCLQELHALFPTLAHEKCTDFLQFVRVSCQKIEKPLNAELQVFTRYLLDLQDIQEEVLEKKLDIAFIHELFNLLRGLAIPIPAPVLESYELCEPEFEALNAQLNDAVVRRDTDIKTYSTVLADSIKELSHGIEDIKTRSNDQRLTSRDSPSQDACDLANSLEQSAEKLAQNSMQLVWTQHVFNEFAHSVRPPLEEFEDLHTVSKELKLKNELWEAVHDAEEYLNEKRNETLRCIDLEELRDIHRKVLLVLRRVQQDTLQIAAIRRLEEWNTILEGLSPVIRDLRNEHFEVRHWVKLENKMDCSFTIAKNKEELPTKTHSDGEDEEGENDTRVVKYLDLPLSHLLEVQAVSHAALIHQVSEEATAEAAVSKSFQSVFQTWETREIPTHPTKDREGRDAICLGECRDILGLIEESEVLLRVMDCSSYARIVQTKMTKMLGDLAYAKEALDLLIMCQQKWEYLQRLVTADFFRTFPEQGKALQQNDSSWKMIMEGIAKKPLCLPFGVNAEHRQALHSILNGYETIAKFMDKHLEMKRQIFPAFFKLSNVELAALVSKVRDINNIQHFLYQCFDNVSRITFGTRATCQDVISVASRSFPRVEQIILGKHLKARGPPEQWLLAVEKRIIEKLRKSTKDAVNMLLQASSSSPGATLSIDYTTLNALPLQCLLLANRILRCELIDEYLATDDGFDIQHARRKKLDEILQAYSVQTMERLIVPSADRASQPLDGKASHEWHPRDIVLMSCIRLQEIEFRDAVADHFHAVAKSGGIGINWALQVKHRFDDNTTVGYDCHVEMGGLRVQYGFNFINPTGELVTTPRTMRSVFSIFSAMRNAQGCLLVGQQGSGKNSLAYQISAILGRRFFGTIVQGGNSFCSVSHCLKLLRGALHCGGTFCVGFVESAPFALQIIRTLGTVVSQIEHSVLANISITGLENHPISWIPGTAMMVACRMPCVRAIDDTAAFRSIQVAGDRFCALWIVAHDCVRVLEALLYSRRFEEPQRTAVKLATLQKMLDIEAPLHMAPILTLRNLKKVVSRVGHQIWKNAEEFERENLQSFLLCEAIMECYSSMHPNEDMTPILEEALEEVFCFRSHSQEWYVRQWQRSNKDQLSQFIAAFNLEPHIDNAASQLQFLCRPSLVDRGQQIVVGMATSTGVILVGPSGVGKSTTVVILAKALNYWKQDQCSASDNASDSNSGGALPAVQPMLNRGEVTLRQDSTFPQGKPQELEFVTIRVVLPMALSLSQLYGSSASDSKGKVKSLLGRLLFEAQENYAMALDGDCHAGGIAELGPLLLHKRLHWVVFDGTLHSAWLDALVCILFQRSNRFEVGSGCEPSRTLFRYCDGEYTTIPPNLRFVFESLHLEAASPNILHMNALVFFSPESSTWPAEDGESVPIHIAYIERYLELHSAISATNNATSTEKLSRIMYKTVAKRILTTDILAKISTVIDEYGVSVQLSVLQRTTYLLSLLQALLNTVSRACKLPAQMERRRGRTIAQDSWATLEKELVKRVEMATVYALLWGFAACCSDRLPLQMLISAMLKVQFSEIADTWEECGREVNLFDVLVDIQNIRFVHLESGSAMVLRERLVRHSIPSAGGSSSSSAQEHLRSIFVPTTSSLVIHAAMREGIRSARGVLLVGSNTSRKTILLQNFLKQIESLRVITSSNGGGLASSNSGVNAGEAKGGRGHKAGRRQAIPVVPPVQTAPVEENAFASVDRIRLHQVTLVRRLAKRFRKVGATPSHQDGQETFNASSNQITEGSHKAMSSEDDNAHGSLKQGEWKLPPHLNSDKAEMVGRFDLDNYIPFFFAMDESDRGTVELSKCMERMLQREHTDVFEPPPGKSAVLIIDDLHLPVANCDERHPSPHAYLRSVYEHSSVVHGDDTARLVSIENLMMVASISSVAMPASSGTHACHTQRHSLEKLVRQFVPVLAPPATLSDLHSIFYFLVAVRWEHTKGGSTHQTVSGSIKQALPAIIAATTTLWERLRILSQQSTTRATGRQCFTKFTFGVRDLANVYEGMCTVEPSYIMDVDTLVRLWTHETTKTFTASLGASTLPHKDIIPNEVAKIRRLLDGATQRTQCRQLNHDRGPIVPAAIYGIDAGSSRSTTGIGATSVSTKEGESWFTSLRVGTNANSHLSYFTNEVLVDSKDMEATQSSGSPRKQNLKIDAIKKAVIGMWAFVPARVYYHLSEDGERTDRDQIHSNVVANKRDVVATLKPPRILQRRSSIKHIRRQSLESLQADESSRQPSTRSIETTANNPVSAAGVGSGNLASSRWIYVDLLNADSTVGDEVNRFLLQNAFGDLLTFDATLRLDIDGNPKTNDITSVRSQSSQLPFIPASLIQSMSSLNRVYHRDGSRIMLIGSTGCGRDVLLRHACTSSRGIQSYSLMALEGVPDAEVMLKKWRHTLNQIFVRVGVDCEYVTLVVKQLQYWPLAVVSQLIALMVTGEVAGAFTLEEQIKLATQVRDERLVEMDKQYAAQIAQIRRDVEKRKEDALMHLRSVDEDKESQELGDHGSSDTSTRRRRPPMQKGGERRNPLYQDVERDFDQMLLAQLSKAQLRYQHDQDDFLRKCEVENESVTATIMSLMRPLGMTSGKWQHIVQRMRVRLRVAVMVDDHELAPMMARVPLLFQCCHLVRFPVLDGDALAATLYGSFYRHSRDLFVKLRHGGNSGYGGTNMQEGMAEMLQFVNVLEQELPRVTTLASKMHMAACELSLTRHRGCSRIPSRLGNMMAPFFVRILEVHYRRQREARSKAQWFLHVCNSMETSLWHLGDRDGELQDQIAQYEVQIEVSQDLLVDQKSDCERIRDMMKRFKEAAYEQVEVTNEMNARAQQELHVPMACLEEANAALLLIDKRHIFELKSFNSPPPLVHLVLDAICVMFGVEPTWDSARRILGDANVVNNMLMYDKDNVSQIVLAKLEMSYISDPLFIREEVEKQSVAASMMVVWVRAVHQYATARQQVLPTLNKLEQARARLQLLMEEYQVSEQRVKDADDSYARTKATLEEALVLKQAAIDDQESRRTRLAGGKVILELLQDDKGVVEATSRELERERERGLTVWNALFAAGFVAYARYFDATDRCQLFHDWYDAYKNVVSNTLANSDTEPLADSLTVSTEYVRFTPSLEVGISESKSRTDTEQTDGACEIKPEDTSYTRSPSDPRGVFDDRNPRFCRPWEIASECGFLFSQRHLQDVCFITHAHLAGFPVVMITNYTSNMEELLIKCARNLWKWTHFYMTSVAASDFQSTLLAAVREGHQLLVLDIDSLDIEYVRRGDDDGERNHLAALFAWDTVEVGGATHLVLDSEPQPDEIAEANKSGDSNNNVDMDNAVRKKKRARSTIPIHPSFRAILVTHKSMDSFSETHMISVPVLSGQLYPSETEGIILDRMWYGSEQINSLLPGERAPFSGDRISLKKTVQDYEAVMRQRDESHDQLTRLIHRAAKHGQFEEPETDRIRTACGKTSEFRTKLASMRNEVEAQLQRVKTHSQVARLGAAIFNAFNARSSVHDQSRPVRGYAMQRVNADQSRDAPSESNGLPELSIDLFLPMYITAIQYSPAVATVDHAKEPRLYETTGAILNKMLLELMPLFRDMADWYEFLLHLLQLMEKNPGLVNTKAKPSHGPEKRPQVCPMTKERPSLRGSVLDALRCARLQRQSVNLEPVIITPTSDDVDTILSWIIDGYSGGESITGLRSQRAGNGEGGTELDDQVAALFVPTTNRLARMHVGLALYPQLAPKLCDRMMQNCSVQLQYTSDYAEELTTQTGSSAIVKSGSGLLQSAAGSARSIGKPHSSSFRSVVRQTTGLRPAISDQNPGLLPNNRTSQEVTKTREGGWPGAVHAYPDNSCVLLQSAHPFGSYAFLDHVFFHTTLTREKRLNLIAMAFARVFQSTADLKELFLVPNDRLAVMGSGGGVTSSSDLTDSVTENVLMVQELDRLVVMDANKLEHFLDEVPLVIIRMPVSSSAQRPTTATTTTIASYWEELFRMICQRTAQRTTSLSFRRYACITNGAGVGVSANPSDVSSQERAGAVPLLTESSPVGLTFSTSTSTSSTRANPHSSTSRRLSTHQQSRRFSDVGRMLAAMPPKFLVVTDELHTIPPHLKRNVLCFAGLSTPSAPHGFSHGSTNLSLPSMKNCIQATLLRIAFHPFGERVKQLLTTAPAPTETASTVPPADEPLSLPMTMLWHYLTSLMICHALLMYRHHLSRRQFVPGSASIPPPNEEYTFDVLTTAISQLVHIIAQFKAGHLSRASVFAHVKHQVLLAGYTRQARSCYEMTVLRALSHECVHLVEDALNHSDEPTLDSLQVGVDAEANTNVNVNANAPTSLTSSLRTGSNASRGTSRRSLSSYARSMISRVQIPSDIAEMAADSQKLTNAPSTRHDFTRRLSSKNQASSLLTGLGIPIEDMKTSVRDFPTWLEFVWRYADSIGDTNESHARDLFGLLPAVDATIPCAASPSPFPGWLEDAGWFSIDSVGTSDISIDSQITLDEAVVYLQRIKESVIPPLIAVATERECEQSSNSIHEEPGDDEERNMDDKGDVDGAEEAVHDANAVQPNSLSSGVDVVDDGKITPHTHSEQDEDTSLDTLHADTPAADGITDTDAAKRAHAMECITFTSVAACYNAHATGLEEALTELISGVDFVRCSEPYSEIGGRCPSFRTLARVADERIRDGVVDVLRNTIPSISTERITGMATYGIGSYDLSLHALVAHYTQWHYELTRSQFRRNIAGNSQEWWLPGLPTRLSISYLLAVSIRVYAQRNSMEEDHVQFNFELMVSTGETRLLTGDKPIDIDLESSNTNQLPDTVILVLRGLELHGASWHTEHGYLQLLDCLGPRVPQRVHLLCQAVPQRRVNGTRSCPLVAHTGDVLHEVELPIGPSLGSLVSPYLTVAPPHCN